MHGKFPAISKGTRATVPNSSTGAFFSVEKVFFARKIEEKNQKEEIHILNGQFPTVSKGTLATANSSTHAFFSEKRKNGKKTNIFCRANFPQKEHVKQFQIVALTSSFLSETGFFAR